MGASLLLASRTGVASACMSVKSIANGRKVTCRIWAGCFKLMQASDECIASERPSACNHPSLAVEDIVEKLAEN